MIEKTIYLDAVEKAEEERLRFVKAVCAGSRELRERVDSLMMAHRENTGLCNGQTINVVLSRDKRQLLGKRDMTITSL